VYARVSLDGLMEMGVKMSFANRARVQMSGREDKCASNEHWNKTICKNKKKGLFFSQFFLDFFECHGCQMEIEMCLWSFNTLAMLVGVLFVVQTRTLQWQHWVKR